MLNIFESNSCSLFISGTNDKAGMSSYLSKWVSPQAVKEAMAPLPYWKYPYME